VGTGTRIVTDPDTKVLDLFRTLLRDLNSNQLLSTRIIFFAGILNTYNVNGNDLTSGLLDLAELLQEVPETGLCNYNVGSENTHTEELGGNFLSGGELASNHLIFGELQLRIKMSTLKLCLYRWDAI
jgi:hypothetical protein